MIERKKSMLSYIKNQKSVLIICLVALGLILLILPNNTGNTDNSNDTLRLSEYSLKIENKIAEMCDNVKGVSSVKV